MSMTLDGTNGITFNNSSTQAQSSGLGTGSTAQTWQNVTASRAGGTTYTNSTGYPIEVCVTSGGNNNFTFSINGTVIRTISGYGGAGGMAYSGSIIVPNGATYLVTLNSTSISTWFELR